MEGQLEWTLFGSKFSRAVLVFICKVIILYISIITCLVNLTVHNGFKGVNKLHKAIKDEGKYTIPLSKVKQWLQNEESFSLHKPLCRAFCHLKVIIGGLNDQYKVDLVDMQKLKDKNDVVQFLLIVIDVFSRFMWVQLLENKLEDTVINAFQHIFQRAKKPRHVRTDRGGEFTGRKVQDYFDSINIEHWTAHNDEMKANFVKRVIWILKKSLWGYMHAKKK